MNMDIYSSDELLIKENEGLIYKIASKYKGYYNIEDLYQSGCIGIIKAKRKYDRSSGCKFSTYAYKYILGEMIDFIRKDKNIVISNEMYSIYKRYLKVRELLNNKYNRDATFKEICCFMNVDERVLLSIIESISISKNIDESEEYLQASEDISLIDKISLDFNIKELDPREQMLINYRYYQGYSQMETASLMGMTQVKVSRNEKMILQKIKRNIS